MATCFTAQPCAPRVAYPSVLAVYCPCVGGDDILSLSATDASETLGATGTVAIAADFAKTESTETLLGEGTVVDP